MQSEDGYGDPEERYSVEYVGPSLRVLPPR